MVNSKIKSLYLSPRFASKIEKVTCYNYSSACLHLPGLCQRHRHSVNCCFLSFWSHLSLLFSDKLPQFKSKWSSFWGNVGGCSVLPQHSHRLPNALRNVSLLQATAFILQYSVQNKEVSHSGSSFTPKVNWRWSLWAGSDLLWAAPRPARCSALRGWARSAAALTAMLEDGEKRKEFCHCSSKQQLCSGLIMPCCPPRARSHLCGAGAGVPGWAHQLLSNLTASPAPKNHFLLSLHPPAEPSPSLSQPHLPLTAGQVAGGSPGAGTAPLLPEQPRRRPGQRRAERPGQAEGSAGTFPHRPPPLPRGAESAPAAAEPRGRPVPAGAGERPERGGAGAGCRRRCERGGSSPAAAAAAEGLAPSAPSVRLSLGRPPSIPPPLSTPSHAQAHPSSKWAAAWECACVSGCLSAAAGTPSLLAAGPAPGPPDGVPEQNRGAHPNPDPGSHVPTRGPRARVPSLGHSPLRITHLRARPGASRAVSGTAVLLLIHVDKAAPAPLTVFPWHIPSGTGLAL